MLLNVVLMVPVRVRVEQELRKSEEVPKGRRMAGVDANLASSPC